MNFDALRDIAREAGRIIMEIYADAEGVVIDRKADNSPLTQADSASNAYIVSELERHYPGVPVISEEEKEKPYVERRQWGRCWQVDPLDGTKEFIKRNGEFTVNIALLEKGRAVAGVIYAPDLDLMAWAAQGEGAYMVEGNGEVVKLESRMPQSGEKLAVVASRSHNSPEMEAFLAKLGDVEIRSAGSSLKFLLVARGQAHLYPRLAPTMEWDTSAGQVILEEAGGEVLVADNGVPLGYNRENLLNPHFMAYAAGVRHWLEQHLS